MKLLIGLGNPGVQYERTRHNAGFLAVDRLAHRHASGQVPRSRFKSVCLETPIAGEKCLIMKPTTFMNLSGAAVAEAVRFYKLDPSRDLLIFVDETAFPAGQIQIKSEGGDGGHNGLADIQRKLGHNKYPRLRMGVDAPPKGGVLTNWVLGGFDEEQWSRFEPAIDQAADAAECFVREGLENAMNRFNINPDKARKLQEREERKRQRESEREAEREAASEQEPVPQEPEEKNAG